MSIEVNIVGQLGNQLFEYACARQLQEIYGGKIYLNTYEMKRHTPNFRLGLLDYKLNNNVEVIDDRPLRGANADNIFVKTMRKCFPAYYFNICAKKGIFVWKSARIYKELPKLNQPSEIILNGYWQCDKYFKDIEDVIKKEFEPKIPLNPDNQELYDRICSTNSVCVTIRRGDFMNSKNRKTFFVCDEKYFSKAMAEMKKIQPDCTFFGFSDEVEWVKNNIDFPGDVYFESGKDPTYEKLRLMSACKNFILSNSSFSWWAQYLSNNRDKTVIAPDVWYRTGHHAKADLYDDSWRLIHIG